MTRKTASATLLNTIPHLPLSYDYTIMLQGRDDGFAVSKANSMGNVQTQSPLGPAPSTAVAMIILYSITGIITAFFLAIIVTGVVRAHRHPERYGPRNVLGHPRQSKALGLGRAILDTIPIVKFGEKEPAKPEDVELGSAAATAETGVASADASSKKEAAIIGTETSETTLASTGTDHATMAQTAQNALAYHDEGIAPAQAVAPNSTLSASKTPNYDSLGCSICTEDFEKGQNLRVLPCDHKFHPECVDPWLLNVSSTCPLCRVNLRPPEARDSFGFQEGGNLIPPITPEVDTSYRRRSVFLDVLSLRQRMHTTPEERLSALRRLRESRQNRSGEVAEGSQRRSVRSNGMFGGNTIRERRDESPEQHGGSSTNEPHQSPSRDESPNGSPARQF